MTSKASLACAIQKTQCGRKIKHTACHIFQVHVARGINSGVSQVTPRPSTCVTVSTDVIGYFVFSVVGDSLVASHKICQRSQDMQGGNWSVPLGEMDPPISFTKIVESMY
jgi:hypothetical protein